MLAHLIRLAIQTEGIGTIRSNQIGPEFQDDGLTSDEGESSDEEDDSAQPEPEPEAGPSSYTPPLAHLYVPPPPANLKISLPDSPVLETPTTPTATDASTPPSVKTPTPSRPGTFKNIPRIFPRRSNSARPQLESPKTPSASPSRASPPHSPSPAASSPGTGTATPTLASPRPSVSSRAKFRKSWGGGSKKTDYNFSAANDIIGIVMLEIQSAADLPRLKNSEYLYMTLFWNADRSGLMAQ